MVGALVVAMHVVNSDCLHTASAGKQAGRHTRMTGQRYRCCNGQHVATAGVLAVAWASELAVLTTEAAFYSNALPFNDMILLARGR
jgi:hypothetical protein